MVAYVGAPWLIAFLGGDRAAYGTTGALFSGVVLLAFLSAVYSNRSVRAAPVQTTKLSVRDALAVVVATQMFAVKYLLGRSEAFFGTMSFVAYVVMLAAIQAWTRFAKRYGKITVLMWNIGTAYAFSNISWPLATPAEPAPSACCGWG